MKKVAFLSYDFRIGGAEKTVVNLIPQFLNAGYAVDLILLQQSGAFLEKLDSRTNIISLNKAHVSNCIPAMTSVFRSEKPDVIISSQTHINIAAILAKKLSGSDARLILTEQNTISVNNQAKGGKEGLLVRIAAKLYPFADDIVVVSKGAAKDLVRTIHVNPVKVHTIYNPIDIQEISSACKLQPDEPWCENRTSPLLIAIGRLEPQKNFSFLLDVFDDVRKKQDCRLIILGEGTERPALEAKAAALGISDHLRMPGAKKNPYQYIAHSDIMLCTSLYEGFNIAVAESLACGTPVISVDCPYGPGEILDGGKFGILTPPGDKNALVHAVIQAIDDRSVLPDKVTLIKRASVFSAEEIFKAYDALIRSTP